MKYHTKIVITVLLLAYSTIGKGQLVVDNNAPFDDQTFLVQSVLLNTGIVVTNVEFNGSLSLPTGANADMIGFFQGSGTNIGIGDGVLINTGNINDAAGPNDSGSDGVDNGTPGDPDLTQLAGFPTFNAAVLEFDFETVTDGISFRYVFASEEYNEFVCSGFNDVFGFFVSGPGVTGPFSNGARNIALIPNSSTYVGINSVNNGTVGSAGQAGGCGGPGDPGLNSTVFFVDNEAQGGQSIQYDGFTTVLTAQTILEPCQTYHMKIAVADAGDGIFDSGVFLEAASFGAVGIQVEVGEVGTSVATMVEGCDSLLLIFSRAGPTTSPLTINFNISGTATNGVDYDFLVDSVIIPVDSSSIQFYFAAMLDGLPEGVENITITIPANLNNATCLDDVPSTVTITIINTEPLVLQALNDTTICPGDFVQLNTNVSGGIPNYVYTWTPSTGLNCTTCPNPVASPSVGTTYTVSVTDDCGTAILTEDVTVNVGGLSVGPTSNLIAIEGCSQASFTFVRFGPTTSAQTVYFTITGSATNGIDYAFIADSIVIPAGQSSIDLLLQPLIDSLSEANESIIITTIPDTSGSVCASPNPSVATLFILNVNEITVQASADTVMCGGVAAVIQAAGAGGVPPLTYSWSDGTDTVGSNQFLNIQPDINTTYTVTVSDTCGNPVAIEVVNVLITSPPPTISSLKDTAYEGCRDALFTISRTDTSTGPLIVYYAISGSATNGGDYTTIPDSVVIPAGTNSVDVIIFAQSDSDAEGDETIILTLPRDSTDTICFVIPFQDTIVIKNVNPITVDAQDELICPGDAVTLVATPLGGVGPISYVWSTGDNQSSTIVNPTDSTTYSITVSDTCGNTFTKSDVIVDVRTILGSVANAGNLAYEGCKNTEFVFTIPTELTYDYTVQFDIVGSATELSDYKDIPNSIVIPAGDISAVLEIETLLDGTDEGVENIVIIINPPDNDTAFCPHTFVASAQIADVVPVEVEVLGDTVICNFRVALSSFASGGFGPLSYSWDNNAGSASGSMVNPAQSTTYTITVTDSCQSSVARDSVLIEVDCEYVFHVPNTFTPNGDGLNDLFNAKWKGLKTYSMVIYNRWGDVLFKTSDPLEGWNGIANDGKKVAEQEVYVYVFETTDFLDLPHFYVGKITIVK
ncbi:MAG: choice-of-anchor L domain-containing protein [Flavobacteriales bacterium]|nr:choice-of-anchor L domain-containing protein [Flavobacteriales bacterium]